MIKCIQYNETHMKVLIEDFGTEQEFSDYFTFYAPGYKFHPKFKANMWDGKIRLFNSRRKTLYKGLLDIVIKFCKDGEIPFECDPKLRNSTAITSEQTRAFIDGLNLHARGVKLAVSDYQYDAVFQALSSKRNLLVSPTSSGKSLMIYSKIRYHLEHHNHRILLVVPTTALVEQMLSDFKDYSSANGWDVDGNVQTLYSGKDKYFHKNILISTWQSLTAMMKDKEAEGFNDLLQSVDMAIFDEAHSYKASVVLETMEQFTRTIWRTGTTGTLDGTKINELVLRGLMGPVYTVTTTRELMDAGKVSDLKIRAIVLKYPEEICRAFKGMKYKEEINFLVANEKRNRFIINLVNACKGNSLILFNFVERHGEVLHDLLLKKLSKERKVYLITGSTPVAEREKVRLGIEYEKDSVVIATASLFSQGINIPSIENIIFAVPTKSTIRVRQSIGRGLRLKEGKSHCKLFDIADDFRYGKARANTTLTHFEERIKIYDKEQFDWTLTKVQL